MTTTQGEHALDPRLNWFICVGNNHCWGRAQSEKQAVANMRRQSGQKATEYVVYAATEETYVNGMGGLNRPGTDPEAVKIKHVKPRK